MQRRQWHPTPVLLPGKSHGRRSLVGCSPWDCEESDMTEWLHFHFSLFTFMHWRRKWQPTPVFCLENPRDGGAWWAAVSGVTQSQTQLKQLSSSSSSSQRMAIRDRISSFSGSFTVGLKWLWRPYSMLLSPWMSVYLLLNIKWSSLQLSLLKSQETLSSVYIILPWCWERLKTKGEGGSRGWDG